MPEAGITTVVCPSCKALNRAPADKLTSGAHPNCGKCHQPLFKGAATAVASAQDFDRFITKGTLPALVDFWAEWCGPCKMMAPMFQAAALSLEPAVRLLKVDTEAMPDVAARYAIRGIPTLILFRDGREIARQSGAMDTATITRWTRSALSRA